MFLHRADLLDGDRSLHAAIATVEAVTDTTGEVVNVGGGRRQPGPGAGGGGGVGQAGAGREVSRCQPGNHVVAGGPLEGHVGSWETMIKVQDRKH